MKYFNLNNIGEPMVIIEYISSRNITILFLDTNTIVKNKEYSKFLKGQIKNPEYPCIFGVGYLGLGVYKSFDNGKITRSYQTWRDMLKRVYGDTERSKFYKDCEVCKEWYNFQNFAEWYENNYYEIIGSKMELDKDIIVKNNKIYSPDTCVFVPDFLNKFFTKNNKNRGKLPIGVSLSSNNMYRVRCGGKYIGLFKSEEEAFLAYKNEKEAYLKKFADLYIDIIPKTLYKALYNYEVEYND